MQEAYAHVKKIIAIGCVFIIKYENAFFLKFIKDMCDMSNEIVYEN